MCPSTASKLGYGNLVEYPHVGATRSICPSKSSRRRRCGNQRRQSAPVAVATCEDHHEETKTPVGTMAYEEDDVDTSAGSTSEEAMEEDSSEVSGSRVASPGPTEVVAMEDVTDEIVRTGESAVNVLGVVLSRWVEEAAAVAGELHKTTNFHSIRAPPMSVVDYLKRIRKYFLCSDECFVMALVYIDRVSKTNPAVPVCSLTVHRLIMISVMLAAKMHDDIHYSNEYYARAGGLCLKETNLLEAKMLALLKWKVSVSAHEYQLYHTLLCQASSPCHCDA